MDSKIVGRRYGRLEVLGTEKTRLKSNSRNTYYRCRCECGQETVVAASNLYQGRTTSCGCSTYIGRKPNNKKRIQYRGKTYTSDEFAKLSGYNKVYLLCLFRQGYSPEEVMRPKKKGIRQRVAEKYGKSRQWVSLQIKAGKTIEEKNGEVILV